MYKRFLLSLAAVGAMTAQAIPLSPQQALERAGFGVTTRASSPEPAYILDAPGGNPALYIFNRGDDGGFLVVSADDVAQPLLGYSDSGEITPSSIPSPMKWWLGEYARQIEFISSSGGWAGVEHGASGTRASFGKAISPMVTARWNQGYPYNLLCPEVNGVRCVTGCVATAMAQVMRFHGYPEVGEGVVSVTVDGIGQPLTLDLSARDFEWDNMLDSYSGEYSQAEAEAVAYLMEACGYAVGMRYTTNESGAVSHKIGKALIDNFGYNPNITYEERDFYNETSWGEMIYEELAARRPVIYAGDSEGGGHQFVCDGYDGNGYFHINWGWGGMSDGYFLLQSLNPADLGIGGGTGGGFSYDQSIICGVQPSATPEKSEGLISQDNNIAGNTSSTARITLKCEGDGGWWNMTYQPVKVSLGVILENLDNTGVQKEYIIGSYGDSSLARAEFNSMTGLREISFLFPGSLPDGRYRATVAYKSLSDANGEWQPVKCPEYYSNNVTITKTGTSYKIAYPESKVLTVADCSLLSPLHYGAYAKVRLTVRNETDVELSQTVAPALLKQGEYWFVADGIPFNLKPGESVSREMSVLFNQQSAAKVIKTLVSFSMKVLDLNTGKALKFSESVEMQPMSQYDVAVENMQIEGAESSMEDDMVRFMITDATVFGFSATLSCREGYFGQALYAAIIDRDNDRLLTYQPMSPIVTISEGESCDVGANIYFDQGESGMSYRLSICYDSDNVLYPIEGSTCILTIGSAGVKSPDAGSIALRFDRETGFVTVSAAEGLTSATLTRMDGLTADVTSEAHSGVICLRQYPSGVYILRVTDSRSIIHTLKLCI